MEDLAHFIQSMSEKYGLLDASHKQHPQGVNNINSNNSQQQQQQRLLQDRTSSTASNTLNSEECPGGSSWECLSIFISGSQSTDCKAVPSGTHHLALPPLPNPKKHPLLQEQHQQADSNSNGSAPLHYFSKLTDIDEHECPPPPYNASSGSHGPHQHQDSPHNDLKSHLGASPMVPTSDFVDRGTSCGDLSTVVTVPDYTQPCCYYPRDNNCSNIVDGTQPGSSFCPGQSLTKNSGQSQQLQQPVIKNAATKNATGDSTAALLHDMVGSKGSEGSGAVPSMDSNVLQHRSRLSSEADTGDPIAHKPYGGVAAASGIGIGQMQQTRIRSRLGLPSTNLGLDNKTESGEFDMGLHEYDMSSGRTSRDTAHTGADTEGCCHQAYDQTDLFKEGKNGMKTNSRVQREAVAASDAAAAAAQSLDAFPSFDSHGEQQERGSRGISGCSCSSTEMVPPAENSLDHHQHGATGSSSSLEYLPITSAMQSKVAQLDEASKELFASRSNAQTSTKSNSALELSENDEFPHNCSSSSDKPPVLKKARSFRDLPPHEAPPGKEDRDPKLSMQQGHIAPSIKHSGDLECSNIKKRPGVSLAKSKHVLENLDAPLSDVEGAKGWQQNDDLLKAADVMEGGAIREPRWSHINKLLCENGFSPLNWQIITSTTEIADKFFYTLNDVVRNYKRRENEVQELLAERESLLQEEKRSNEIMQKLEYEADLAKRKLASSEQRAELASAAAEKTYALLRKDNQRLEASNASMLQRCRQLEHGSRAKERALRKLQEKIQEAVQREDRQRQKEKELYEKLKKKFALGQKSQGEVIESNFLLRDLKPATIVGLYERQRARAQVEMNFLREENSRLCQELCEKENSILSKAKSAANVSQAGFDKREHKLFKQLTEIDNILKAKTSCGRKMAIGGDTALEPWMDSDQGTKTHRVLQETSRKQLDLKTSSALLAGHLDGCTGSKCQEFLAGICTQLKLTDPVHITGAIDGLLKVVAAVPRMETFVEQVCEVVFNDGAMMLARGSSSDMQENPESVPSILKSWLEKLQSVDELQQFKDSVTTQLWERFDENAVKHPMSSRVAAASVKDLIETERQYLLTQASYREGDLVLKAEPQKLLHCIIKHFQMLFEIPRLDGVMAVMNSLYIQISEYHNFARALCSMLGLSKDAGPNSIISTVTSILNKG